MLLQIELRDLRNVIYEKCEELIADKKMAYELYLKICEIEEDPRFKDVSQPDCEHAEHDGRGCLGYSGCSQDDEPIDACKKCGKYTGNVENVIAELEKIADEANPWKDNPPLRCDIPYSLLLSAIKLLKAQEPIEPYIKTSKSRTGTSWWYSCRNCNRSIDPNDKYCRNCGKAVKWDDRQGESD